MSHKINQEWLESAKESFEEAIESGQWALARDIVADVKSNGFRTEYETLNAQLVKAYREDVSEHE